jgi:Asp-tRNA(Asn)/Glu-tRNA(Gln) amidotransferase A subunit family amidase
MATKLGSRGIQYDINTNYDLQLDQSAYMGLYNIMMGYPNDPPVRSDGVIKLDHFLYLQQEVQDKQLELLDRYDAWILPVTSVLPYHHNLNQENFERQENGIYEYVSRSKVPRERSLNYWVANGMYCRPVSVSGFPTITLPIAMIDGLPLGIQVVGKPDGEDRLFEIANSIEHYIRFKVPKPEIILSR